ncbi:MAG: hypothetical protein E7606_05375 [Ruminococcaceae bacterium]|nr:hypothetical protein [Oscillospiraceae bacterium]
MTYGEISGALRAIEDIKTGDIDRYNRKLIAARADVRDLASHVLADPLVHRTYFQVSLALLESVEEQLDFIETNEDLLDDWWHVDQLPQFLKKPLDFASTYERAMRYIRSEKPFTRRWGYVIFLTGLQKERENVAAILSLMKDDDAYYVQMAEAWLLCDLAVFHSEDVLAFMRTSTLQYNILGKAIQKIQDSFRIGEADKVAFRALREIVKKNG